MPEAPEHRPGHVGHTPQPVSMMLRAARARAIVGTVLARVMPQEYVMAPYRSPQNLAKPNHIRTLLQLEDAARGSDVRQPNPLDFRAGLDASMTRPPR